MLVQTLTFQKACAIQELATKIKINFKRANSFDFTNVLEHI